LTAESVPGNFKDSEGNWKNGTSEARDAFCMWFKKIQGIRALAVPGKPDSGIEINTGEIVVMIASGFGGGYNGWDEIPYGACEDIYMWVKSNIDRRYKIIDREYYDKARKIYIEKDGSYRGVDGIQD